MRVEITNIDDWYDFWDFYATSLAVCVGLSYEGREQYFEEIRIKYAGLDEKMVELDLSSKTLNTLVDKKEASSSSYEEESSYSY
jgi:hypothetical protein